MINLTSQMNFVVEKRLEFGQNKPENSIQVKSKRLDKNLEIGYKKP